MSALARFNGLAGRALWAVQRLVNGPRFLKTLTAFEAGAERGLKYGTPALAGLTIALLVSRA